MESLCPDALCEWRLEEEEEGAAKEGVEETARDEDEMEQEYQVKVKQGGSGGSRGGHRRVLREKKTRL